MQNTEGTMAPDLEELKDEKSECKSASLISPQGMSPKERREILATWEKFRERRFEMEAVLLFGIGWKAIEYPSPTYIFC